MTPPANALLYDVDGCALVLVLLPTFAFGTATCPEKPLACGALVEYDATALELLLPPLPLAVVGLLPPKLWRVPGCPDVETPPLRDVLALELTHEPVVAAGVAPVRKKETKKTKTINENDIIRLMFTRCEMDEMWSQFVEIWAKMSGRKSNTQNRKKEKT